jgi:hypothetical protein
MTDRDDQFSLAPPSRVSAALGGSEREAPMPSGEFAQGSVTTAIASTSWSQTSLNFQPTRSAGAPRLTLPPTAKSIANNGRIEAVHAIVHFSPATIVRRVTASAGDIPGHRSRPSPSPARDKTGNRPCSPSMWSSTGWRRRTRTSPSRRPRACCRDGYCCCPSS